MPEPSPAQKQYLRRQRRDRGLILFFRILLFAGFLILWEAASSLGWIDSFIFSSPSLIGKTFVQMTLRQSLFTHIGITLGETLLSFFLVVLAGLGFGVILWGFPRLSRVLEPYLVVLNSLPKSALAPLLIVWLGANGRTIVVAGMSVAIFGTILNLYTGFTQVDPDKQKLIRTLGGGRRDVLFRIVLPSSLPLILSIMKVNIGLCLVGVIIGEFIGARQGLGYLIIYSSQTFKLTWMLMSIVILCLIAMILYGALALVEKHCLRKR
ncbi:MAG: ABC transporter permease [Eubacteriales bacterium]|nr:ABC transporter permease [Eubacteriales bacterium]